MKIDLDKSKLIWDFFLRRRVGVKVIEDPIHPRKVDTIYISDKAKRQLKDDYIEKNLNSGKPMTGVTYEEYCDYYEEKMI